jgi:hypothetical protein
MVQRLMILECKIDGWQKCKALRHRHFAILFQNELIYRWLQV